MIIIKTKTANISIKPSRVTLEMFKTMVSSHFYVTAAFAWRYFVTPGIWVIITPYS